MAVPSWMSWYIWLFVVAAIRTHQIITLTQMTCFLSKIYLLQVMV